MRHNIFIIRVIPIWNDLPDEVKHAYSINKFKNKYDDHMNEVNAKRTSAIANYVGN